VVLLALTSGLLDEIAVEKIPDAEAALIKNLKDFPDDVLKRLFEDKPMSGGDHDIILKVAGQLIDPFKDKPQPGQNKN